MECRSAVGLDSVTEAVVASERESYTGNLIDGRLHVVRLVAIDRGPARVVETDCDVVCARVGERDDVGEPPAVGLHCPVVTLALQDNADCGGMIWSFCLI